jgi:amino acid adenylation domain-containing protein
VSAELLLSELRALDIRLFVENNRLRCSAPKGGLTRALEQRIAAQKSELIQALQASTSKATSIPRRPVSENNLPLSFAQERFWFLQNLDPETSNYNITAYQCVVTPVDVITLELALGAVVSRHEILRSNFPERDGSPAQIIHEQRYPELVVHDFSHLQPSEMTTAVDSAIERLSNQKFDLASEPLLRVALIRGSEHEHRIVLTMHHLVCDAWSIGIFFGELKTAYEACARGRSVQFPRLPIQYGDYAIWERNRLASGALSPQLDYWTTKLKGAPQYLDIPLDHPRANPLVHESKLHRFQLDASTSQALKLLAQQEGATLFMALLTIFKALLSRYTKQNDIMVGTPVTTRTQSELEGLIGCFINTHVLRTEVPKGVTTRDLLARVRATVLESLNHTDIPFETLINKLVTERDLSRSPLFQIAFILQNTPSSSAYEVVSGGATFDMTLYMWESKGVIGGSFEYNANLFNCETIASFAGCYETLARAMTAQPDAAVERLPVLTATQEADWFARYDGPASSIPEFCTHEWVERQVNERPNAIAVACEDEKLTFRELSNRSNRLAHRLRELGVREGGLVALCLNRSVDLVVAPLAVWKAGGAYIPLDPEFPKDRLAFMLEDSGVSVLVTESQLLDTLPSNIPTLLCLDHDRQLLGRGNAQTPDCITNLDSLAYVLYTSGSTGKPKGVEITHRSLVNFLSSMQGEPGIAQSDRLLAVTTFSFDIAGLELYLPLVSGAQVVIAPRAAVFDGNALARLLDTSKINLMQATPATWRFLLQSGWHGTPGLKILCGGEALTPDLAEQLLATGAEVWNLYGPTETTIWSTLQRVALQDGRVSIGRPIANTQVHILDEFGQPVPPGVAGELYIGGDGLARGYLHREQLTAERFISSPFHNGIRLYRTGDLARRLSHGSLECIGRVDHQVKLRGFRIELGEIETALERQPDITQAAVVLREDKAGDQQLTAYITAVERVVPDFGELRKSLLTFLPTYMIPSFFVQVDTFPLTPNRKVDRKALLAPEYRPHHGVESRDSEGDSAGLDRYSMGEEPSQNRYIPPSNNVELAMAQIWREVLDLSKVSVLDNFFELGGHSLSAARLISRIRAAMDMDLPLRCIFIHPTIADLASHISYDSTAHGYRYTSELPKWSSLVPVQPKGRRTPLFLVTGYQSPDETLLELAQLIPHLGIDQPLFGFRPRWIEGRDGYATVEEMAREFVTELRAVQPKGPYLLGGHCVGGIAALEVAQLLLKEGEDVRLMALLDTERPTAWRTFLTDLYFMRQRASHIMDVFSEIIHAKDATRRALVRKLIRRKLKEKDQFYQSKVDYRRLLYSHTPKHYAGRITLIVNEKQARFDRDLGWTGFSHNGLELHTVPGDHFTVMKQHAKEVAQVILNSIGAIFADSSHENANRAEVDAV